MGTIVELTDHEWERVADLFDPDVRRGAPETGVQWRYRPERFPPWTAVSSQWRRWQANGVWEKTMGRLARTFRMDKERDPEPSMLMVDAQTAKGGRAGPTFRSGCVQGARRSRSAARPSDVGWGDAATTSRG